jgi:hypothetical protein
MRCDPILIALARSEPIDPRLVSDELVDQAIEHRMGTVLLANLEGRSGSVPIAIVRRLVMEDLRVRAQFMRTERLLQRCANAASALGVEIGTIKGVTTAERFWSEDPSIRYASDVDIFLPPDDRGRAGDLVAALAPDHPMARHTAELMSAGHVITVAVHTNLGLVELHRDPFGLALSPRLGNRVWELTEPMVTKSGAELRVLNDTITLLQLLINSAKDNFAFLMQVSEIKRVIERGSIDWSLLSAVTDAEGWGDVIADALHFVRQHLGCDFPAISIQTTSFRRLLRLTSPAADRLGGTTSWQRAQRFCKLDLLTSGRRIEFVSGVARRAATPSEIIDAHAPDLRGPYVLRAARFWLRRQQYVSGRRRSLGAQRNG